MTALAPPPGEAWLEDLLACVHCGFCLPACPTYDVLVEENDSPRGRLYLMRALAEGRLEADGAFELHIGRCLGCRACETSCPAGVPYGSLLERARARTRRGGARGAAVGALLFVLTAPGASRLTWAIARLARTLGLAGAVGRLLPGRAGTAAAMLAATRPSRSGGRPGPGARRPAGGAAAGRERGAESFALLEGCVMRGLFGHVHDATRRALGRRGRVERPAPGQACCGALHAHAGRLEVARGLARRNIEAFERSGADVIVTDSAGCGAALRDYAEWLRDDPAWASRASGLAARVRDVTELLTPGSDVAAPAPRQQAGRVAYDAPCHLLHAQGIRDEPLRALSAAGVDAEPLPSWERCCGGAGLYNVLQPGLSDEVLRPKLEEIAAGEYGVVTTGNPGCLMFLGAGLRRAGLDVDVAHPVELVDAAERAADSG